MQVGRDIKKQSTQTFADILKCPVTENAMRNKLTTFYNIYQVSIYNVLANGHHYPNKKGDRSYNLSPFYVLAFKYLLPEN
ncbi:hypothetical protein SNE25_21825 [Mucilaginibacter sabulilitoris]|uniref:Uncharacterized protein n=1 Tax=Mucilaginibacter sabulilitoris TaxID=1173583 RepID=A0ABZ0TFK2_9SPHI|nr:hypothetical protein [Mucilaginibacter sabulilitoris]WPU91961.1 hypothetical protein SNE25_21825 [Mucilaginibacter sabulilitoris]